MTKVNKRFRKSFLSKKSWLDETPLHVKSFLMNDEKYNEAPFRVFFYNEERNVSYSCHWLDLSPAYREAFQKNISHFTFVHRKRFKNCINEDGTPFFSNIQFLEGFNFDTMEKLIKLYKNQLKTLNIWHSKNAYWSKKPLELSTQFPELRSVNIFAACKITAPQPELTLITCQQKPVYKPNLVPKLKQIRPYKSISQDSSRALISNLDADNDEEVSVQSPSQITFNSTQEGNRCTLTHKFGFQNNPK